MTQPRFLAGLLGEDIGGTRSPWIHETEADTLGLRLVYMPVDVAGQDFGKDDLRDFAASARRTGFAGFNVTHPFKQAIIEVLDSVDPAAESIGAVNTVVFDRDRRTRGYNTDTLGFAEGLRRGLGDRPCGAVLQLGAGGAGSATANALFDHGCERLDLFEPSAERGTALADRLRRRYGDRVRLVDDVAAAAAEADGIVNATPIGMQGHEGVPLDTALLRPRHWVADVIYFPAETQLLAAARSLGCATVDGVDMVVFQAAAAFQLFTGVRPDAERMRRRLRELLATPA